MEKATPFLMFQKGKAEEAMKFYTGLIEDSEIMEITRYGPGNPGGDEGTVMRASFTLKGREFHCIDSNIRHGFDFTPSFSIFLTCSSEEEIDRLYKELLGDGEALMPIGEYGFSRKFGWVNDRFGVSWQLDLPF
ncbi:VOC family protein [Bhargavaea ullalensis]|uniref:3-demethylubiquinone-9 3-methyltransferase (Glyoxalase superfamily) n=1 Tax=Bhargavaea ullalensis TaxID=1265685 RepID=A0ABV2GA77_9BACL